MLNWNGEESGKIGRKSFKNSLSIERGDENFKEYIMKRPAELDERGMPVMKAQSVIRGAD